MRRLYFLSPDSRASDMILPATIFSRVCCHIEDCKHVQGDKKRESIVRAIIVRRSGSCQMRSYGGWAAGV